MSSAKRKKTNIIDTDEAEQQIERETGDIYDGTQRGEMLKAYGITAAEKFFHARKRDNSKKEKTPLA